MKFLIAFGMLAATSVATANEFGCPHCQSYGGICVLRVEQVDDEEDCYEIECEEICIPAVHFPWQSCRTPKCGRARVVAKLKKESRETKTCKYEWVRVCDRCGRPVATEKDEEGEEKEIKVPPAPKDAPRSGKKSENGTSDSPPMPPAAPPVAWVPPQPPGSEMVPANRPVITPRPSLSSYSVRSSTR